MAILPIFGRSIRLLDRINVLVIPDNVRHARHMRAGYIREKVKVRPKLEIGCLLRSPYRKSWYISRVEFYVKLSDTTWLRSREISFRFSGFFWTLCYTYIFRFLTRGNIVEHVVWLAVNHVPTISCLKCLLVIARGRLWDAQGTHARLRDAEHRGHPVKCNVNLIVSLYHRCDTNYLESLITMIF